MLPPSVSSLYKEKRVDIINSLMMILFASVSKMYKQYDDNSI